MTSNWTATYSAESHILIHVPHSSVNIPQEVRQEILLDNRELSFELLQMTDSHTEAICLGAIAKLGNQPSIFINQLSRLVFDPERFPDEREEMERVGMGAVYTSTHDQKRLRYVTSKMKNEYLEKYFWPYTNALEDLTARILEKHGKALIIDLHSYPSKQLPYELHGEGDRPEICIGSDEFHTSSELRDKCVQTFSGAYSTALNTPFIGTYTPSKWYGKDSSIQSVMLEIRRDTYMNEATGELDQDGFAKLIFSINRLMQSLCA